MLGCQVAVYPASDGSVCGGDPLRLCSGQALVPLEKTRAFGMTPVRRNIEQADYFFFIRRYWITDKTAPIKAKPIRTASAGL
jgi:hypothetical protein